ncbi:MAG: hypothetical protein JO129_04550 [Candidatus Dependentiae bacterium]|nr:hypothetical protein [Candidatus Dependentiae bacterium]
MKIKNFIFLAVLLIGQLTYCDQNIQEKFVSHVMQQASDQQQTTEITPQSLLALLYSNAGKEYEYYKNLIVNYFKKLYEENLNSEDLTPEQLAEQEESKAFWKDYNDREKEAAVPTRSRASRVIPDFLTVVPYSSKGKIVDFAIEEQARIRNTTIEKEKQQFESQKQSSEPILKPTVSSDPILKSLNDDNDSGNRVAWLGDSEDRSNVSSEQKSTLNRQDAAKIEYDWESSLQARKDEQQRTNELNAMTLEDADIRPQQNQSPKEQGQNPRVSPSFAGTGEDVWQA